jgi:HAD superfamily hydrolase (TIGR01549 family)
MKEYRDEKDQEPFVPKLNKADFLNLWQQYRIGIITDGVSFKSKLEKIRDFYGVDIDGYIHYELGLEKKPSRVMFDEFLKKYHVNQKVVAYIGDNPLLDGGLASNANLYYIPVAGKSPVLDIQYLQEKLSEIYEKKNRAKANWSRLIEKFSMNATDQ